MKIRIRITILFTLITAVILIVSAAMVCYSAKKNREAEFYTLLEKEAITKANLFLNAGIDKKTLQDIYYNNRTILNEAEVAIYDTGFNLLYHDAVELDFVKESREMTDAIYQRGMLRFYQEKWQVVGLRYNFGEKDFIVTAAAYDLSGYSKLHNLVRSCILVCLFSVLCSCVAGYFFSAKVFAPVSEMTGKARRISASNLHLRLSERKSRDELAELADTFNEMLGRLESSFESQKIFVSNIAHELRTPLAALIAELELSSGKERSGAEYKAAIAHALADAQKITRLANNMLDLARAGYDRSEIAFRHTRVDEVLLDARQHVMQAMPGCRVDIHFEEDFENEQQVSVRGNEYLLRTAFANLFENGCKFSRDRRCSVSVAFEKGKIILCFSDRGIGIAPDELEAVFVPFYRGRNGREAGGYGIGLSLVQKIILMHNGVVTARAGARKGTVFVVELPAV